ncbi:MAG: hypothetical protein ACTHWH_18075 [Marinobacter sp.]
MGSKLLSQIGACGIWLSKSYGIMCGVGGTPLSQVGSVRAGFPKLCEAMDGVAKRTWTYSQRVLETLP